MTWPLFETFEEAVDFGKLVGKPLILQEFVNAKNLLRFMEGTRPEFLSNVLRGRLSPGTPIPRFQVRESSEEFFRQLTDQANEEMQAPNN